VSEAPLAAFAIGVVGLALAALIATFIPGMWLWGLSGARFVLMPWRLLWLLPIVTLLPPLARPLLAVFDPLGRALDGRWGGLLAFVLGALLVLPFGDQTWFTGDFLQRLSGLQLGAPTHNYTGAMPIDWFLYAALPRLVLADPGALAMAWMRTLGALECGLLVWMAREWVRAGGWKGADLAAGVMLITVTGGIAVFTGLGKPAGLLAALALGVLTSGVAVTQGRGQHGRFGLLVTLALLLHRSSVLLLPAWLTATIQTIARDRPAGWPGVKRLAPLLLPLVVVLVASRRLLSLVLFYDLPHHLKPGGSVTGQTAEGGWLGLPHLIDIPNVVVLLAPAFVLMLPVLARTGPPVWRDRAEQFRLALAIPALVVLALVFPQQGIFRDLDVFTPWTTVLGAIAVGALVARLPAGRARTRWLARAALVAAALGMAVVVTYANPDTGLERVRAYLVGPPVRDASTRSLGWDFLIGPYVRRERYDDAEASLREAIALAPHRRLFLTWGLIEVRLRHPAEVARAYTEMSRRWPDDAIAWYGLAAARDALGDTLGREQAIARMAALVEDRGKRLELARYRADFPEMWPQPPARVDTLLARR
jgi:hypothetical protein